MKRLEAPDKKDLTYWCNRYDRTPQIYPVWPPKPLFVLVVVVKRKTDQKMYAYVIGTRDDANMWIRQELNSVFRVLFFQLPQSLLLNKPDLFPDDDPLIEKDLQYDSERTPA